MLFVVVEVFDYYCLDFWVLDFEGTTGEDQDVCDLGEGEEALQYGGADEACCAGEDDFHYCFGSRDSSLGWTLKMKDKMDIAGKESLGRDVWEVTKSQQRKRDGILKIRIVLNFDALDSRNFTIRRNCA